MQAEAIFQLTELGRDELLQRRIKLKPKQRALLHFMHANRRGEDLLNDAAKLGLDQRSLEDLIDQGLIGARERADDQAAEMAAMDMSAADALTRYRSAQQLMNETIVDQLGLRAFLFTMKLERCATLEDLRPLAREHRDAYAKSAGPERAYYIYKRVMEIINGQG